MTTYILAGGNDRTTPGYGEHLQAEISKYVAKSKILSCFYSSPEEAWPEKAAGWENWFRTYFGSDVSYSYARQDIFLAQIDDADVVYLHGGNTQLLFDTLPATDELISHFAGKIVVGSSAGANALSTNYWSSTQARPLRGLGFTKLNIMVHYGTLSHEKLPRTPEDWRREEAEFAQHIGGTEIVKLPEGQFVVDMR